MIDQERPEKIVIFEPEAGGHQASHVRHLVSYVMAEQPNVELIFALSHDLIVLLPTKTVQALEDPDGSCCKLLALPDSDVRLLRTSNLALRGLYRWFYLKRLAQSVDARHAHFQYFDHALLGTVLPFQRGGNLTYSGLLFRPSVHYAVIGGGAAQTKERWRDWVKSLLYNRMLGNPQLTSVFSLDAYFAEYAQINLPHADKVIAVPDPVPVDIEGFTGDVPLPNANADSVSFLLFGALSERKGVFIVLNALASLAPEISARCHIRFAGRVEPAIREEFYARLEQLTSNASSAHVEVLDRYLDEDEILAMIMETDVVLAPYIHHVGSSGVLYWAAAARKPVITQDYGLMGREAREFGLGLTADTLSTPSLVEALTKAIHANGENLASPEGQARFINGHTPHNFAAVLIQGMVPKKCASEFPQQG